jgi:hypothetical protein
MLNARMILFVLAAPLVVSPNLAAQSFPADSGSRVRIVVWTGRDSRGQRAGPTADRIGTLVSASTDTIRLQAAESEVPVSIARADITAAYVSRSTHTNRGNGALIGTAIGLAVGAVVGYKGDWTSCDSNGCRSYDPGESGHLFGAALVGGLGALLGAGIGVLAGSTAVDDWERISASRSTGFIMPRGTTISAGMRIRW